MVSVPARNSTPAQSKLLQNRGRTSLRPAGTHCLTANRPRRPNRRAGPKAARHPQASTRNPAKNGPMAAVKGPIEPQVPSALPRSPSRKIVAIKAMPRGIMPAMPNPCTARPNISQARLVAKNAIAEPTEKNSDSGQDETAEADAIAQAAVDGHQNHIGQNKCAGCPGHDVSAHGESVAQEGQGHAAHGRTERHDRRRYHQRIEK